MRRPGRRRCPSRCCCARRSGGARSGWSARPRPSPSRATCTRVDPFLAGRKVELVFDPFDLSESPCTGRAARSARAVPQVIGRHAHPKAPPDEDPAPAALTGIDYLQLVADADQAALGEQLNLAALDDSDDPDGDRAARRQEEDSGERRGPARQPAGLPAV